MCPSLIEIGSKTAEKNSAQRNRQTNKPTDATKIMVTWLWTNNANASVHDAVIMTITIVLEILLTVVHIYKLCLLSHLIMVIVHPSHLMFDKSRLSTSRLSTLRLNQLTWAVNLLLICYHPCQRSPFIIIIIHSKSWYSLHHPMEDRRLSQSARAQDLYYSHCCDKGNCCNEIECWDVTHHSQA